eukprot:TRINITY_DN1765_c0_g1_i3.p1 TRINITY_DN1765_c0_g1~~TRINITY_DN1765_c0_g1_i3.p1  ORF type:complete len:1157 (-),score=285.76 TRINITY_DN1765_c0_g1_i3:84-3554(-)
MAMVEAESRSCLRSSSWPPSSSLCQSREEGEEKSVASKSEHAAVVPPCDFDEVADQDYYLNDAPKQLNPPKLERNEQPDAAAGEISDNRPPASSERWADIDIEDLQRCPDGPAEQPASLQAVSPSTSSTPETDVSDSSSNGSSGDLIIGSPNSWSMRRKQVAQDPRTQAARIFKSLLNKLTPQKFTELCGQIVERARTASEHVDVLIQEVYERAISEQHSVAMYAAMCEVLVRDLGQDICSQLLKAIKEMLDGCWCNEAPADGDDQAPLQPGDAARFVGPEGIRADLGLGDNAIVRLLEEKDDQFYVDRNGTGGAWIARQHLSSQASIKPHKKRSMNNVCFLGHLVVKGVVPRSELFSCAALLMKPPRSCDKVEALTVVLKVTGPLFDRRHEPRFRTLFTHVRGFTSDKQLSTHAKTLVRDLLDLRASKWVDNKVVTRREEPKRLEEVREEFRQAEAKEEAELQACRERHGEDEQAPQSPVNEEATKSGERDATTSGNGKATLRVSAVPCADGTAVGSGGAQTRSLPPAAVLADYSQHTDWNSAQSSGNGWWNQEHTHGAETRSLAAASAPAGCTPPTDWNSVQSSGNGCWNPEHGGWYANGANVHGDWSADHQGSWSDTCWADNSGGTTWRTQDDWSEWNNNNNNNNGGRKNKGGGDDWRGAGNWRDGGGGRSRGGGGGRKATAAVVPAAAVVMSRTAEGRAKVLNDKTPAKTPAPPPAAAPVPQSQAAQSQAAQSQEAQSQLVQSQAAQSKAAKRQAAKTQTAQNQAVRSQAAQGQAVKSQVQAVPSRAGTSEVAPPSPVQAQDNVAAVRKGGRPSLQEKDERVAERYLRFTTALLFKQDTEQALAAGGRPEKDKFCGGLLKTLSRPGKMAETTGRRLQDFIKLLCVATISIAVGGGEGGADAAANGNEEDEEAAWRKGWREQLVATVAKYLHVLSACPNGNHVGNALMENFPPWELGAIFLALKGKVLDFLERHAKFGDRLISRALRHCGTYADALESELMEHFEALCKLKPGRWVLKNWLEARPSALPAIVTRYARALAELAKDRWGSQVVEEEIIPPACKDPALRRLITQGFLQADTPLLELAKGVTFVIHAIKGLLECLPERNEQPLCDELQLVVDTLRAPGVEAELRSIHLDSRGKSVKRIYEILAQRG